MVSDSLSNVLKCGDREEEEGRKASNNSVGVNIIICHSFNFFDSFNKHETKMVDYHQQYYRV